MNENTVTILSMLIGIVFLFQIYRQFNKYKQEHFAKEIQSEHFNKEEQIAYLIELIQANKNIVIFAVRQMSLLFVITFLLSRYFGDPTLFSRIGAIIVLVGLIYELELINLENKKGAVHKSIFSDDIQLKLDDIDLDHKYLVHGIIVVGTLIWAYGDIFILMLAS